MLDPGRGPGTPVSDRKLIRRVIAQAIAEQGPAAREQYQAAVDVMRALSRAGFVIVRRVETRAVGVCLGCPYETRCHDARRHVISSGIENREECPFYLTHLNAGVAGRR